MMNNLKVVIASITCLFISVCLLSPINADAMINNTRNHSSFISEDMSEGYSEVSTRGMYLQSGLSRISKAGAGKVTVTGITFAQQRVEDITVNVELQYLDGGTWKTYKTWTETAKDDISVEFVKTLEVEPGTYRVVSLHSANSDASSSFTRALYIS